MSCRPLTDVGLNPHRVSVTVLSVTQHLPEIPEEDNEAVTIQGDIERNRKEAESRNVVWDAEELATADSSFDMDEDEDERGASKGLLGMRAADLTLRPVEGKEVVDEGVSGGEAMQVDVEGGGDGQGEVEVFDHKERSTGRRERMDETASTEGENEKLLQMASDSIPLASRPLF